MRGVREPQSELSQKTVHVSEAKLGRGGIRHRNDGDPSFQQSESLPRAKSDIKLTDLSRGVGDRILFWASGSSRMRAVFSQSTSSSSVSYTSVNFGADSD